MSKKLIDYFKYDRLNINNVLYLPKEILMKLLKYPTEFFRLNNFKEISQFTKFYNFLDQHFSIPFCLKKLYEVFKF